MQPDTTKLADLCEAAEGPSRELDAQIALLVMPDKNWLPSPPYQPGVYANPNGSASGCPAYTASIDAALTLVPDGHWWSTGHDTDFAWATVTPWGWDIGYEAGLCKTPALALVAAALRTRGGDHD